MELFSLLAFALLLRFLLEDRPSRADWRLVAASGLFFALWANLHAGFVYGLLLIAVYAVLEPRRRLKLGLALAAGAAGALCNPYGRDIYSVLAEHVRQLGALRSLIWEWGPLRWRQPSHWPAWLLLAGSAIGLWRAWRAGGRIPAPALTAAAAAFAFLTLRHARAVGYFAALAVPLSMLLARDSLKDSPPDRALRRAGPWAAGALCAACLIPALWWGHGQEALSVYWYRDIPARTAAFLAARPDLAASKMYNPWEWGGYLGFRLGPDRKVFQDGRYMFVPLLEEAEAASRSTDDWQAFLDRHEVGVAVLKAPSSTVNSLHHQNAMPAELWYLVHADGQALVYERRDIVPPTQ